MMTNVDGGRRRRIAGRMTCRNSSMGRIDFVVIRGTNRIAGTRTTTINNSPVSLAMVVGIHVSTRGFPIKKESTW